MRKRSHSGRASRRSSKRSFSMGADLDTPAHRDRELGFPRFQRAPAWSPVKPHSRRGRQSEEGAAGSRTRKQWLAGRASRRSSKRSFSIGATESGSGLGHRERGNSGLGDGPVCILVKPRSRSGRRYTEPLARSRTRKQWAAGRSDLEVSKTSFSIGSVPDVGGRADRERGNNGLEGGARCRRAKPRSGWSLCR